MASKDQAASNVTGEILIAWQKYTASGPDEINLEQGDAVELLDTTDPNSSAKRIKLDPELDTVSGELLDNSAARHKLSVRPRRTHASTRHSPTRLNINKRWLVKLVTGKKKQGWVPCRILQTADDPMLSSTGLPGDAAFRRQAVVKELVETEQEFVRDLDLVVQRYLIPSESGKTPKIIKDNFEVVFGNLKEIAEFHRTVLMEGVRYYANDPVMLGKAFLRLERDFDKHVYYCRDEPLAQEFLDACDAAFDYFADISQHFGDDKSISEHLKLPIQRINDYQLLLKELVRYSACLGETHTDLQKALELMLSVPHRAQDEKFISSIEGYRGSIHKLGRLIAHDRFSVTFADITKERYLFLFSARILICKVRRISEDRSIFQLKDIIRLPQVELKDYPDDHNTFELIDRVGGQSLILKIHRDAKELWLKEIKEFAKESESDQGTGSDEFQIVSPPTETAENLKSDQAEKAKPIVQETTDSSPKPAKLPKLELDPKKELTKTKTGVEENLTKQQKELQPKVDPKSSDTSKDLDQSKKPPDKPKVVIPGKSKEQDKLIEELKLKTKAKQEQTPNSLDNTKKEEKLTAEIKQEVKLKSQIQQKQSSTTLDTTEKETKVTLKTESKQEQVVKVSKVSKQEESLKETNLKSNVKQELTTTSTESAKTEESVKVKRKVEEKLTASSLESKTKQQKTETKQEQVFNSSTSTKGEEKVKSETEQTSNSSDNSKKQKKFLEELKLNTQLQQERKSCSSESTLVVEPWNPGTTTTATDLLISDSETLKQVSTPESETVEDHHLKRIQAVEPLVQLNKPRVLEEVIPYVIKPPPELVPGSAIQKVYSFEKTGASEAVITDFKVGVEVSVEVGDEMSRRYTSSARAEGGYESSYSSRRAESSYSTDPLSSSRYNTEISSSKYGSDLTGGSKYEGLSSKYSKYSSDLGDTSSYSSTRKPLTDNNDYSSFSRKSIRSSAVGASDDADAYSYSRRIKSGIGDDDGDSYTSRRLKSSVGDGDLDSYSSYSKRGARSITRTGGDDLGDSDNYSYTRRSIKTSLEGVGDGDNYSVRKSYKSSLEGTGIDPMETEDSYSYSTKKALGTDLGSKYSRRSVSTEDSDYKYGSKRALRGDDEEDLVAKYSRKYLTEGNEEEDKYAKYTRKYSRTDSSADKKLDEEEEKYTRKYSRTESKDRKKEKEIEEDDAYERYARKYLRKDSEVKESEQAAKREKLESAESEIKSSYEKIIESDNAKTLEDKESSSVKISSETTVTGTESKSESFESKQIKTEAYLQESKSESAKKESSSVSSSSAITEEKASRKEAMSSKQELAEDSISTTLKIARETREKSAEQKLEELEDGKLKFVKNIRGTSIEPGEQAQFDVLLNLKPESFCWLKDNKPLGENGGRIQTSSDAKGHEYKVVIKQAKETDAGVYTAIAQNEQGKISCTAQLVVHELTTDERSARANTDKPEFLVSMKDAELLEETYLRFMVKIAGEPNPVVTFFKDGVKITENAEHYQVIKEHSDKGFYELVIAAVKKSDAGTYKCVATNKFGEASSEAKVTVTDNKQVFEDMPEGEILPPGEKPVFHWKKDGAAFEPEERFKVLMGDDEDSLALVFQKVRPDDVGLYTCVAQTSRGHISCSAELTVHGTVNQLFREPEKPKLVIIKRDPIVNVGGSAMLELQVIGYPKPNIKWTHDGKTIEASKKHKILYEDEESVSLVIKDVQSADAGVYSFIAENELGVDTAEMTLTVQAPPKIKTKMEDISVHTDILLKMDVEIEGIPKPKVQFYKDGKVIKQSDRIRFEESGEKYTLIIEKTSLSDTGSYSVIASNELAQVTQFWNLDVYSKPKITQKLGTDKQVSQGETVELRIKFESEPKPEVKWFKGEEEIKSSEHFVIKEEDGTYILKITGAVTTDAANYKVRAVNIHGSVDDDINIFVKKAPKIIKGLQNMTVTEHDKNVTFDVKVEAFPKPTVKWYLDEVEIKETRSEFTRMESDNGVMLVIKEVSSELSGQYTCKLSNECGAAETSAKLTVNCAPRILKQLKDTTVEEGASLHLEVEVEGCPEPTVKWLRNGREVSADARIKISRDTQRHETYNLAVNLIKYEEQGEYEVIVTNALGTVSSKSHVTVHKVTHTDAIEETEEPPKQIKVEVIEEEPQVAEKKGILPLTEVEIKESTLKSPEPIIEEPESPIAYQKVQSATIEEVEHITVDEKSHRKGNTEEQELPKRKAQRGISVQIEEMNVKENSVQTSQVEEKELLRQNSKTGKIATIEDIQIKEDEIEEMSHTADQTELPNKGTGKKGILATKESGEILDKLDDQSMKHVEMDEESNKTKPKKGRLSQIEEANVLEASLTSAQQVAEEMLDKQESKKGKHSYGEDEKMEELSQKAQRQKSLIENVTEKPSQGEAAPIILDTNMRDGSRPESLNVTYIVRAQANPPPIATWLLDGKEIKPDSNLRMTASQNGEEFRLEIKKLDMKDAGVYQCILSNPVGDVTQQAVLEVTPEKDLRRPKLKEGLKNQSVIKKSRASFKAVIIGDPIPDVTWYKDGKAISPQEMENSKMILESEDHEIEDGLHECTFSLSIPRCEVSNDGKYTIKAKNKWGECESSASLTIVMRPEIEGPQDVSVVPGEATEFTVIVYANPVAEITWTKDDRAIKSTELIKVVEDLPNKTYKLVFHKVLMADEGYYKVTAKNDLGEASSEARLRTVKEAEPTTERPKFITGLVDEQVDHLGEVTLMVRADGLPKPAIKWYVNGQPLAEDATHKIETSIETQVTSKLTILEFDEANSGIYKAMAVNPVGEAETTSRVTMRQTPPSFGKKLERNEEVNEGEPLELKAKINGSPKPTVAWYKDGEPISDDGRIKITILPDGTVKLNIDKCRPSDSGAYKLVVKNPNGETACLCAVAVTPKPRRPMFTRCFKDAKIPLGETLRLEAQIEAYPPPEVRWLKDGVPVRPSSNIHFETYPDGRVVLVVDCMKPENVGNYQLIATNKLGEATGEALVEIETKPKKPHFTQTLQPQTVVEGFPVKFEVKAEGVPTPKITWTRNGAEIISENKHIKIVEKPDGSSSLVIDAADIMRDALTYGAIASNEAGEAETSAPLTVKSATKPGQPEERPVFLHALRNVITDEGQALIMEAPFTANPIPHVEWTKDGIPVEPSERILITCDGTKVGLRIDKALPSDAGIYSVKVINPLGEDSTEGKATVKKIFQAPSFTQKFTDLQQLPDRDAKFPCRVSGVPQPEVTWTKDGELLRETDKYHIKRDGDLCCLYVLNCEPSDAGIYRAIATNPEGEAVCTAALEVVKEIKAPKKIEPPTFLKRIGDLELYKAMTAKFTACASGMPEPTVEWFHNDKKLFPSTRIKMDKDTAGLLRLTISGVDEDDLGKYSCKISNEHGSDICHAELKFDEGLEPKPKRPITDQYTEFDKYKRSGAPMPIADPPIISQMTDRHCTLSWNPSISSGPRIPVTYQLEMCELPNGDWFTVRTGIRGCVCGVRNLEPFRNYKFRVRVENKYGISDPSPYAITQRDKLEPDLPKFRPYLPPEIDFRPETSPYFPKDFDIERPPHDGMAQAPRFLRQEHDTQYGVKDQNTNLFWFVYGYPKPKVSFYFNDELIESGGRFSTSYTRNGQATLFINKMLDRDAGWYEAVARNEHGEARQRVRLEIAELPYFIRRPEIEYVMLRGRAKFEARILGIPYPDIKWYKDWKPLAPSSRIKITFIEPDTTILVINDIILKDEGLYSVSARNVAGTCSSSAMLHVEENENDYKWRNYFNLSPIKTKRRLYSEFYDIGDELGRGTQGITYHAVERLNGRNYAAKVMHGRDVLRPFMYNELDMLNELRHKKLISLHDAYENEDTLALILELTAGGELVRDYLLKMDYYTESDIAGFIRQLLQGLDYMHDKGYAHMGIDLGDLLIAHPGGDDLKITDFSLTRRIQTGNLYPLLYGMPEYCSPEVVNKDGVGYGQDMWSVGIITHILLSGRSPFRGDNDRETLTNIRSGKWSFDESWWSKISVEARDFITKLLVFDSEGRMDVRAALRHPWLERADKRYSDDFQISSKYLSDYWRLYREWYDNASCRRSFRRRPLEGAFTHPSKMVYPPGEIYTPRATPTRIEKSPRIRENWEDLLPTRSPLNYEIGGFRSESHYQNGPDTYLLQLRDVDFPVRLREYMKVAANRGPGASYIVSDENGYDWRTPIIRERRRFTDIMDEEIDDERKERINRYGSVERDPTLRRIKHEIGSRLDAYVEAEAFLEAKQEGRLPFFREKPKFTAMREGQDLDLSCFAVGEPQPIVQWFKNDAIIAESHRIKIITDAEGRSYFKLRPALQFDQGMYKVVARNKIGQTIARTRIVMGLIPDEPDSPEASQVSDTEILLTWKQPRFDGNSPVVCYKLEYKVADETEWIKKADNIDHEFYLIGGLETNKSYIFRLAAKNSVGWSDSGVPSAPITTKPAGSPKIQLGKAMLHLQQITDSGRPVEEDTPLRHDYKFEAKPIEWQDGNPQDNYNFISEIARGRFSVVLKAVDTRSDSVVVAKVFDYSSNRKGDVDGEFAALRSLRHERIASLLEAYRYNGAAAFILEKLQGADILTYLASRHEYTEQTVATIVTQVLDGLQYLHWRGLCHLDLQPDNVVMCGVRSVQIKLVDLGSAHRVSKLGTKVPIVGHPDYISPELLAEEPAFPQTDIWTVGVLTYIMLSGTVPFRGEDENESRQNVLFVRYRFEHLFQEVSQEATRFLMLLFKRHPNKRPTPEECHENRWLLPTDYMIKKRDRASFFGHRLKEYSDEYHCEKEQLAQQSTSSLGIKLIRSHSIQEELLTAP